jgi:hypothetical protein
MPPVGLFVRATLARRGATVVRDRTRPRMSRLHQRRRLAWLMIDGLLLASCFFAPLIAALDAQVLFLHWEAAHTLEAWAALVAVAAAIAALRLLVARVRAPRVVVATMIAIAGLPLLALAATLLRSFPDQGFLIFHAANPSVRVWGVVLGVAAVAVALTFASRTLALMRAGRIVLAPVLLVTVVTLLRAMGGVTPGVLAGAEAPVQPGPTGHILILVFDELSMARVYRGTEIVPELAHLARLGATSRHYLNATSPGGMTLESLSGYVALRRFSDLAIDGDDLVETTPGDAGTPVVLAHAGSLFGRARTAGYRTELFGTYLPYCRLLGHQLDRCEDFSFYNTSSVNERFSPLDAVSTNLIFLPRQFPTGYAKGVAFAHHQRRLTDRLESLASSDLPSRPTLRFVHFSVPHSPFVFSGGRFAPPSDPLADSEEAYRQQLLYVDRMLGRLLQRLDATGAALSTTVVVTSDHEWRTYSRRAQWPRVPLLVHRPGQVSRDDDERPAAAEAVIGDLLAAPLPAAAGHSHRPSDGGSSAKRGLPPEGRLRDADALHTRSSR